MKSLEEQLCERDDQIKALKIELAEARGATKKNLGASRIQESSNDARTALKKAAMRAFDLTEAQADIFCGGE